MRKSTKPGPEKSLCRLLVWFPCNERPKEDYYSFPENQKKGAAYVFRAMKTRISDKKTRGMTLFSLTNKYEEYLGNSKPQDSGLFPVDIFNEIFKGNPGCQGC